MGGFRIANEFAAVDVESKSVPWGQVLVVTDARTGISVELDALEVEALTTLDRQDRDVLVNRSAGNLERHRRPGSSAEADIHDDDLSFLEE